MDKKTTYPKPRPYDLNSIAAARTVTDAHRPTMKELRRPYELSIQKTARPPKNGGKS